MNANAKFWLTALVTLVVGAGTCLAHPYSNYGFAYALDLPAGWVARSAEDANPAEFVGPEGVTAKLRVIPRPQPLSTDMAAKLARSDEEKIGAKFAKSRAFSVSSVALGAMETHHYGVVYLDQKAEPRVLRFTVASRPAPAGHVWLKLQFAYPRLKNATVAPALDQLIKSFHWIEAPVVAKLSSPDRGAASSYSNDAGPIGQVGSTDVTATLAHVQAEANASAPPPGEVHDADSAYYLSLNQKMSEKDTQAHIETFRGDGTHRTEEEMARARSYGMGDILKPNE